MTKSNRFVKTRSSFSAESATRSAGRVVTIITYKVLLLAAHYYQRILRKPPEIMNIKLPIHIWLLHCSCFGISMYIKLENINYPSSGFLFSGCSHSYCYDFVLSFVWHDDHRHNKQTLYFAQVANLGRPPSSPLILRGLCVLCGGVHKASSTTGRVITTTCGGIDECPSC